MSAHTECCPGSADLCALLFIELAKRIPDLQRSEAKRWCGLHRAGRPRFAYVSHFKRAERIEIWCRGDPEYFTEEYIGYQAREQIDGGWGHEFPGRFSVSDARSAERAADVLYRHAYPTT